MQFSKRQLGYITAFISPLCWAMMANSSKLLMENGMSALTLVQARLTFSGLILLLAIGLIRPKKLRVSMKDLAYLAVLGIAGFGFNQFFYFEAIKQLNIGPAILLEFTGPTLIVLYSVVFEKARLTFSLALALGLALVGGFLAVGDTGASTFSLTGVLAGIGAAICLAFLSIFGERTSRRLSSWTTVAYAFIFGGLFWNIVHTPLSILDLGLPLQSWGYFGFIVMFGTVIPFGLYLMTAVLIGPARACLAATLEPVFAAIIAFFFLGELMTGTQVLGGVFVLAAVIIAQRIPANSEDGAVESQASREYRGIETSESLERKKPSTAQPA